MRKKSEDRAKEQPQTEAALGEVAKTVGGLEKGQRGMVADERRIKDQGDRIRSGDANLGLLEMASYSIYR